MAKKKAKDKAPAVSDFRREEKRENTPPARMAAEGTVPGRNSRRR